MTIVIRRRRKIRWVKSDDPPPTGEGWPDQPGYPQSRNKQAFHVIEINGRLEVLRWDPFHPLEPMWTCGLYWASPSVMQRYSYKGECTPVYRAPSEAQPRNPWRRY